MFRNFFRITLRNIIRQKVYSIINIAGLAIGIACSIIITAFILHELSYDKFHESGDSPFCGPIPGGWHAKGCGF
jgi:putative ABC transport system permease protein